MATKILKLTSGEDIIGDYEVRNDKCFIGQPAKIIMYPTDGGGLSLMLMPWTPFTEDEEIEIKKEFIMSSPMEPSKDVRNDYSQRFGTGVVDTSPTPGDLIL